MFRTVSAIAVLAAAGAASAGTSDVLLEVDTSVADQVTITATSGLAAIDGSGGDITGVLLAGLLDGTAPDGAPDTNLLAGADLTTANETSDGTPDLFIGGGGTDTGLNIWTFTDITTFSFTAGSQAFSGSATWDLDTGAYAAIAAPGASGDIYFPADDSGDIPGATGVVGRWVVVPAPGAMALLGLAGVAGVRRRRA